MALRNFKVNILSGQKRKLYFKDLVQKQISEDEFLMYDAIVFKKQLISVRWFYDNADIMLSKTKNKTK